MGWGVYGFETPLDRVWQNGRWAHPRMRTEPQAWQNPCLADIGLRPAASLAVARVLQEQLLRVSGERSNHFGEVCAEEFCVCGPLEPDPKRAAEMWELAKARCGWIAHV